MGGEARVGCRWCDYETGEHGSHFAAMNELEQHAKQAHPDEYEATVRRPIAALRREYRPANATDA